jgi:hypothetical protein
MTIEQIQEMKKDLNLLFVSDISTYSLFNVEKVVMLEVPLKYLRNPHLFQILIIF